MRPNPPAAHSMRQRAFTLVEVLVALVILIAVVLILTQIAGGVATATTSGHKRMDADGQARLVLDRLAFDMEKMLKRDDLDYTFQNASGNDFLSFYAATQGYSSLARSVSVLGYRINAQYQLERAAKGIDWSAADGAVFTPFVSGTQTQQLVSTALQPTLADTDYQVLGDQVFRFEFSYLVNGTASGSGPKLTTISPAKISDMLALVVSIAVLDQKSRAVLSGTAPLATLANLLSDPQDGQDTAENWTRIVNSPPVPPSAGIPTSVVSAIRIYQRYYYLQ